MDLLDAKLTLMAALGPLPYKPKAAIDKIPFR